MNLKVPSQALRIWMTLIGLAALLLLTRAGLLGDSPSRIVHDIANDGPNQVGLDLITQNYYEELLKEEREPGWRDSQFINAIVRTLAGDRRRWQLEEEEEITLVSIHYDTDFLERSMAPYQDVIFRGVNVKTNRWGHRDTDDYDKEPEPGVFRIALVGSSNSFGMGVAFEDGLEQLLETKLNTSLLPQTPHKRIEIVNLSVNGYHLLERVYVARNFAPEFKPDLMLFEVTLVDMRRSTIQSLVRRIRDGRDLGFDYIRDIVRRSHATASDPELKIEQRLQRLKGELVVGSFDELADLQRETGIPIAPMILRFEVDRVHPDLMQLAAIAQAAGLHVLRVYSAYDGREGREMNLSASDFHPSTLAHSLLAEDIYDRMLEHPVVGPLLLGKSPGTGR